MSLLHCLRVCDVSALQELARVRNLSTVDVAAVRLWLDKRVQPETASNVMAGFDPGVGATFFDLNTLQVCMHHLHAHKHTATTICTICIIHVVQLTDVQCRKICTCLAIVVFQPVGYGLE